jgi:hypothetical protein
MVSLTKSSVWNPSCANAFTSAVVDIPASAAIKTN